MVLLHGDELSMKMDESMGDGYLFRGIYQRCDLWLATTMLSSQSRGEVRHVAPLSFSIPTLLLTPSPISLVDQGQWGLTSLE